MKQLILGVVPAAFCFILYGCLPLSAQKAYTHNDIIFDSNLVGKWSNDPNDANASIYCEFKATEPTKAYTVFLGREGKQGAAHAVLFKLNDQKFLDIDKSLENNNDVSVKMLSFSGHLIVRLDQISPELRFATMDETKMTALIESEPNDIEYCRLQDRILLTAPTQKLQKFLLQHAKDENLFTNPQTLKRINDSAPAAAVNIYRDVEYARIDGSPLLLDIYVPKSEKPLPVIACIHGGGWYTGDKGDMLPISIGFLEKGYAVTSINYRLSDKAKFPAQINDCKGALRFLRANAKKYNLDSSHIGVWGISAGGHLVALLGTTNGNKSLEGTVGGNLDQSSDVQAVCDYCGPTDLTRVDYSNSFVNSVVSQLLGGPVLEKREMAIKASPITYVDKNSAPFFIVHGSNDETVDVNQSKWFYEALKKVDIQVDLTILSFLGHNTFQGGINTTPMVQAFFDKHLKNNISQ